MLVMAVGKVAINGSTATEIVGARSGRTELRLTPSSASGPWYGPDNTVTATSGYPINNQSNATEKILQNMEGSVWAIGGGSVYFLEIYDDGM